VILSSIRWRLQAWHGLILVSVLAGFGVMAWRAARDAQLQRIDEELEQRLMGLLRPEPPRRPPGEPLGEPRPVPIPGPRPGEPGSQPVGQPGGPTTDGPRAAGHEGWGGPGRRGPRDASELRERLREAASRAEFTASDAEPRYYFVAWEADGSALTRSPNAPADVPAPSPPRRSPMRERNGPRPGMPFQHVVRERQDARELAASLPEGPRLLVGRSIGEDRAAMRGLAYGFAAVGAGVLALGLVGGWWLATRAIRPIRDISTTALRIAAGDLSQRIDSAGTENELGRLADVLNATFARLEASFAQQARFTSDASHELRTPLAVIVSQAQTALARDRPAAEYREALEACLRAAERMRRLSESLLDLARLDSGDEPMRRAPFDLARVAREALELLQPLAAERGVVVEADLPLTFCRGDAERVGQVVTNLVKNAIDFNRPGGAVRIAARAEANETLLSVADTGAGIPAEDLPHVFERFYRADRSRSGSEGRIGLGLAICRAIVDAHSGTLTVESRPGEGSTFTLRLPRD
jgi:two-component system, OmpR family, sensor kinase